MTKNPHAVALGKIKSPNKAESSRKNGKLGGRPQEIETLKEILADYLYLVGAHDENRKHRFVIAQRILNRLNLQDSRRLAKLTRPAPSDQEGDTK